MDKYAIVKTGGKQYLVQEGQVLSVDRLKSTEDKKINFGQVLLIKDNGKLEIGTPTANGSVEAEIIEDLKGKKIRVSKFKAKTGYRRNIGFRSFLTKVKISSIKLGAKE